MSRSLQLSTAPQHICHFLIKIVEQCAVISSSPALFLRLATNTFFPWIQLSELNKCGLLKTIAALSESATHSQPNIYQLESAMIEKTSLEYQWHV